MKLADGHRGPGEPQDRNRTNDLLPVTVDTRRMQLRSVTTSHKQHDFKVMPVMLNELELRVGPGKDSELTTGLEL